MCMYMVFLHSCTSGCLRSPDALGLELQIVTMLGSEANSKSTAKGVHFVARTVLSIVFDIEPIFMFFLLWLLFMQ